MSLVQECLRRPSKRPDAPLVLERVRDEKAKIQMYHGTKMAIIKTKKALEDKLRQLESDHENDLKISQLKNEIETLTKEKADLQTERDGLETSVEKLKSLCNVKSQQIETKDSLLSKSNELLQQKEQEVQIERKSAEQLKESLEKEESKKQSAVQLVERRRELVERERDQAWQQLSSGDQVRQSVYT